MRVIRNNFKILFIDKKREFNGSLGTKIRVIFHSKLIYRQKTRGKSSKINTSWFETIHRDFSIHRDTERNGTKSITLNPFMSRKVHIFHWISLDPNSINEHLLGSNEFKWNFSWEYGLFSTVNFNFFKSFKKLVF